MSNGRHDDDQDHDDDRRHSTVTDDSKAAEHPEVLDIDSAHTMRHMERGERLTISLPNDRARLTLKRTRQPEGHSEWEVLPGQHYSSEVLRRIAALVRGEGQ